MKLNEYNMQCFAAGEEVTVEGKQYRFVEIVPNGYNKCDLYSEGQERAKGFCGRCSGCGSTFPEGTVRGRFEAVEKIMKNFKLYQIKNDPEIAHGIKFSSLDWLKRYGLIDRLSLFIYYMVYEGEQEESGIDDMLENIFAMFQFKKPTDYKGHSVSMSDIVEIDNRYYYCDEIGWTEITIR